ncbi:bifunctional DNA primase/polymerase [Actinocorallia sp. A-T 12471]|uniref:bifunctional DNA primase/polymerase n=1 Tax=Actinocorallia sp. A-T 12471 TaxID=3089813 RepID=UPI0029CB1D3F|nr:bifunctional DNA primase/polymerase [Actinocorallia sp. A-T 12471]MDX6741769.1 bifunctional DNA primase/polymerase [Actinocorallia sp. A-T 12471]
MLAVTRYSRTKNRLADAARDYARRGWTVVAGASAGVDRACSCDRIGCPDPGAHPVSAAWGIQATAEAETLNRWWSRTPAANVILPTGLVFDVFDVPAATGRAALEAMAAAGVPTGPVAGVGDDRLLFFVATRGNPEDEAEWWSCHLDSTPETIADNPGMRWHCRDSYVVAPPSVLPSGREVFWVRPPDGAPLPDPLRILEYLAE